MKPFVLIVAALVLPLIWGYLAEQILRRIWPRRKDAHETEGASLTVKREQPTQFPDYQI